MSMALSSCAGDDGTPLPPQWGRCRRGFRRVKDACRFTSSTRDAAHRSIHRGWPRQSTVLTQVMRVCRGRHRRRRLRGHGSSAPGSVPSFFVSEPLRISGYFGFLPRSRGTRGSGVRRQRHSWSVNAELSGSLVSHGENCARPRVSRQGLNPGVTKALTTNAAPVSLPSLTLPSFSEYQTP